MTRAPSPTPSEADRLAFRAAADVCRRGAGDLHFASAFLPRAKRDAAQAAFAFFLLVRDAITSAGDEAGAARLRHRPLNAAGIDAGSEGGHDACCSADSLEQRLSLLRERLDDLYSGRLELPSLGSRSREQHVLHGFAVAASRYQIPREVVDDFARGCRAELTVRRYATWESVERDCRLTGGSVARAAACVLGVTHSGAGAHAVRAGTAIRFTRMLCDLKADAAAGQVRLPLEDLVRFRYTEQELAAGVVNGNFRRLMQFETERARWLFDEAAQGLCWVANDGARLAAALVLAWYRARLDVVERRGYDVFSRPPALTRGQKLRAFPLAWRLARRGPDAAPVRGSAHPAAARR